MREGHHLSSPGLEVAVVPERVGVQEIALDHVRQGLDVPMRMERPLGAGHDPIIVEDTQGTDALLFGIAVAVEAEMPSGVEPAALLAPDRVRFPDDHILAWPLMSPSSAAPIGTPIGRPIVAVDPDAVRP